MICKLVKVFHGFSQVGDSQYMVFPLLIQSMRQTPLSQSIEIQNSTKWKDGFRHGGQNKVAIEIAYIPMLLFLNFFKVEQRDMQIMVEWNISKNLSL